MLHRKIGPFHNPYRVFGPEFTQSYPAHRKKIEFRNPTNSAHASKLNPRETRFPTAFRRSSIFALVKEKTASTTSHWLSCLLYFYRDIIVFLQVNFCPTYVCASPLTVSSASLFSALAIRPKALELQLQPAVAYEFLGCRGLLSPVKELTVIL